MSEFSIPNTTSNDDANPCIKELIDGLSAIEERFDHSGFACCRNEYCISENPDIPKLGWLVERDKLGFHCTVGKAVEVFENGFIEGVWAGDFSDLSTALGAETYGSGVYFGNGEPTFIQRKDVREFTFILRDLKIGRDYISNSLPFILAAANITESSLILSKLDECLVSATFEELKSGFHKANPLVAKTKRYQIFRLCYADFYFDQNGSIKFIKNFTIKKFSSYRQYKNYLLNTISSVFKNGAHPKRKVPLSPVTSISRGYDSVAVSALAAQCGCRDAVTLAVRGDNGASIGRTLGLQVYKFQHVLIKSFIQRFARRKRLLVGELDTKSTPKAHEFIATAGIGDDITSASFEPVLENKIFLSGVGGDGNWEKGAKPNLGMQKQIAQSTSLTEFRLRVGFAHFPPILSGSLWTGSLVELSSSKEMRPFSVGGDYDRPIARRIIEEAGVARSAFGKKKKGQNPYFTNGSDLWRQSILFVKKRYTKKAINARSAVPKPNNVPSLDT